MTERLELLMEENKQLKLEIKKLNRQLNLANDNMMKYRNVTSAKEILSAVVTAEKSKQEKQLRVIMENTPDLIILLDRAMHFLLSSESFLTLAGIPSLGFLQHKSFRQVFSTFLEDAWLKRMEDIFRITLETNEIHFFDEELRIGTEHDVRNYAISVIPFAYSSEKNEGLLVVFHDITERIEMENRIKEALNYATAASKAKSDFLANMSHEIRTPMNAIIGMTNIGMSAADIERKDNSLAKISDASRHLLGVINDILDMSKIEAGKLELASATFDFEKMLRQVTNVIQFRVEESRLKLNIYLDKSIPPILIGDDQRLAQVITNLLGNAVKFTPKEGSISLNTCFLGEENGVCFIEFSVTDTGIGIEEEHQARLFQAFTQAETDTSRKFGGTGLGLTISKSIIELMGGTIWVESKIGTGSTFAFTVQLKRGEQKRAGLSEQKEGVTDISGIFQGHRILLVEDVDINREIVQVLLEPTLLEIDCAADGAEAVRMFGEDPERYEMIFMDLQMPEMDGYEATRRIRAIELPNKKAIPIIAMTANVFKEDVENCLKAGMDGHVGKPLDFDEILNILRESLLNA